MIDKILKTVAEAAFSVEYVDDQTYQFRLSRCGTCDFFSNGKCKKCGCYMEVKAATRIHKNPKRKMRKEVTHCPIGMWEDKEFAEFFKQF